MDIKELESFKLSDAIKFHNKLNPRIWSQGKLRPEVKKQLEIIAEDFITELGISGLNVEDITLSGSNAAYTYTPNSDLDLHILVDMDKLDNDEVYRELFQAKKTLYNDTHDIKIHGVPVELYVQDTTEPVKSLGEYSLLRDEWIKIPKKRKAEFDQQATRLKYEKLESLIHNAMKSKKAEKIDELLKTIKRYRQAGLDKAGEFSPENLAYKALRNKGYIQKLYDLRNMLHTRELSIEDFDSSNIGEARRNPEQNIKAESGKKELLSIAKTISDPENWAISMTVLPKLGINPGRGISEDTPKGIYFYPLDYALNMIRQGQKLPWGDNLPYIQLFQYDRSNQMTQKSKVSFSKLRKALRQYCPDEVIEEVKDEEEYNDDPYWFIYNCLILVSDSDESTIIRWNKILRQLGFTCVFDPGNGWIAYNEPTQGIILDPRIIKHHKTIINRTKSDHIIAEEAWLDQLVKDLKDKDNDKTYKLTDAIEDWHTMNETVNSVDFILASNEAKPFKTPPNNIKILYRAIVPKDRDINSIKSNGKIVAFATDISGAHEFMRSIDVMQRYVIIKKEFRPQDFVLDYTSFYETHDPDSQGSRYISEHEVWMKNTPYYASAKKDEIVFDSDKDENLNEVSGYIPSKKQKNDPRFKTALTVDVKPNSIKKNAKAFGFDISRAGIPPLLRK